MVAGASLATYFGLKSFNDNLMYFFSTTDVVEGKAPKDTLFRLGGMVIKGSVERPNDGLMVRFKLSDFSKEVTVEYTGILPDLFKEGQGIVAHGKLNPQGVFVAEEVLAKHDENYMPPEVKDSLKNKPATVNGKPESI
jgi:cytochrome c-type biogenesis protein CcmE